jgi:peptide deformylase
VSKEVDLKDSTLRQLVDNMFDTMYVSDGVGLAAPQIGKSLRIFVIDGTEMAKDDPSALGFKRAFINPRIIEETGDMCTFSEGCLSLPSIHEEVERRRNIRIQYYDENLVFHDDVFNGVKARIIQHEYDHLDGILFIDRMTPLRKKMLKGKLNDIIKGKVITAYKAKVLK